MKIKHHFSLTKLAKLKEEISQYESEKLVFTTRYVSWLLSGGSWAIFLKV